MTDRPEFERRLEARLVAHADRAARPFDAAAIAMSAARTRVRSSRTPLLQGMAWRGFAPTVAVLLLVGLLIAFVGVLLFAGSRQPFQAVVAPTPPATASPSTSANDIAPSGPVAMAIRSTWVADASPLPSLENGGGQVSLSIDSSGGRLSVDNFAPGAAFASSTDETAPDQIDLVLDGDSAGCPTGAEGRYRWTLSPDGLLLTLVKVTDTCSSRAEALARTWARSLTGTTFRGAGIVDTMAPTFAVTLPDEAYQARKLDDFIEIGGSSGFSLMVFKNPQGFADSCSDQEVRYPYTPGAAAFVAYYRQNDAFTVVEATPLKIDGLDAIHLVTKAKVEGARCPSAPLYALTPKACDCHFLGGDDSLYLVDVGTDTFLFQLSPTTDIAAEMPIVSSIRIPYELPSQ